MRRYFIRAGDAYAYLRPWRDTWVAAKVLATLDREWDGLARHRDFPDLPLDNYVEGLVMPRTG